MAAGLALWLLLLVVALGILHAALSWRRPLPVLVFILAGAACSTVLGLAVIHRAILGQARLSWLAGVSAASLGLGFLAAGAVVASAWLLAVRALPRLLRRTRA